MNTEFAVKMLDGLKAKGRASPRRRQHFNLHSNYADPCQRFLNAMQRDSYIRPHRHAIDPKEELLVAISGVLALCLFDDDGHVSRITPFASEAYWRPDISFAVQVEPTTWHTVISLTREAVLLEVKAGPFDPNAAKELAPWAPDEGNIDRAQAYLALLHGASPALIF